MADSNPSTTAATATSTKASASAPNAALKLVLWVVVVLLAGYAAFTAFNLDRRIEQTSSEQNAAVKDLQRNVQDTQVSLQNVLREAEARDQRIADFDSVYRSVRSEVLGLGERAALLEDAVSSLADKRMENSVLLQLNEAEFLLRLGQERLALFNDVDATISAFQLADASLAALDDSVFAGVRQTLAVELEALAAAPRIDEIVVLRKLDAIAKALPTLPTRYGLIGQQAEKNSTPKSSAWWSRAGTWLRDFVRVRRVAVNDTDIINPLQADALRLGIQLELMLAKSAAVAQDGEQFLRAVNSVSTRLKSTFDADHEKVKAALLNLDQLAATQFAPLEIELGRSLSELRNLRATRAMANTKRGGVNATKAR